MNKGDEYSESKEAEYTKMMATEVSKLPKNLKSTVQCTSMRAILERPIDQDEAWCDRPLPLNWKARPIEKDIRPRWYWKVPFIGSIMRIIYGKDL